MNYLWDVSDGYILLGNVFQPNNEERIIDFKLPLHCKKPKCDIATDINDGLFDSAKFFKERFREIEDKRTNAGLNLEFDTHDNIWTITIDDPYMTLEQYRSLFNTINFHPDRNKAMFILFWEQYLIKQNEELENEKSSKTL